MTAEAQTLLNTELFSSISPEDLTAILSCLKAQRTQYKKDELILVSGSPIRAFGVVLSGSVQILREDAGGRQNLLSVLEPGDTFAEVFVCAGIKNSPVTVLAATEAVALFLDYDRVVHSCSNACAFHSQLIANMLRVLAQKNLVMNRKISYLLLRGMRHKLCTYLLEQWQARGQQTFEIPLSRGELADFLGVDRSALSRELGRMREEGLIDFYKSSFRLLKLEDIQNEL